MTWPRDRQGFKLDYQRAVGQAALCFAACQWNIVNCAERIRPRSIRTITGKNFNAGTIAEEFVNVVRNMPPSPERDELSEVAERFRALVPLRNRIIHGKPCTGPNGEARLYSRGVLEIPELEAAADAFSECSIEANRLLHGFLSTYEPNGR